MPPSARRLNSSLSEMLGKSEAMGVEAMRRREEELLAILWPGLAGVPGLHLLADQHRDRLAILSFYIDELHYNLAVRLHRGAAASAMVRMRRATPAAVYGTTRRPIS